MYYYIIYDGSVCNKRNINTLFYFYGFVYYTKRHSCETALYYHIDWFSNRAKFIVSILYSYFFVLEVLKCIYHFLYFIGYANAGTPYIDEALPNRQFTTVKEDFSKFKYDMFICFIYCKMNWICSSNTDRRLAVSGMFLKYSYLDISCFHVELGSGPVII